MLNLTKKNLSTRGYVYAKQKLLFNLRPENSYRYSLQTQSVYPHIPLFMK